ncbi:MAG: carboxypeptidase regulatory-like domain-containing protein [Thermoanaerobaculia bacterium]
MLVRRFAFPLLALSVSLVSLRASPGRAGEIRGRLLLGDKPASGVTISAVPYETPLDAARCEAKGGEEPKAAASTVAGADGSFLLSLATEPPRSVVIRAAGSGARAVEFDGVFESSEWADLGEHVLAAGASLAGKVVDDSGQPVVDAIVTLRVTTPGDPDLSPAPVRTKTAADGTFRLDGAAASGGLNTLRIEKAGLAPHVETLARAGILPKPVLLSPGASFSGRVTARGGRGAAGALVRFEGRAATRWVEASAEGTFTIPDAPPGKGTLVADAGDAGYGELTGLVLPLAEGRSAAVTLLPAASLSGRVIDSKTLRGIPRAKVEVRQGSSVKTARSAADGSYRITPLLPRSIRISADEPRYVPLRRNVEITSGETKKLDAPLVLGASLTGRVTDENGQPVAGAQGALVPIGETGLAAFMRQVRASASAPLFRTATDGTFRASRLMPGASQRLTVAHPEFASSTLGGLTLVSGQTTANVSVVLRHGAAITGVVHDKDGNPLEGAEAEVQQGMGFRGGRGGAALQMNILSGAGGPRQRPAVKTGADGRFEIRGLTPGDYTLWLRKSGFASERIDPVKVPEEGSPEALSVTLDPGAAISGVVRQKSGTPAEGWSVVSSEAGTSALGPRARGNLSPTGSDGLFVLDGLKPGQPYDLQLFGGPGLGPSKKNVIPPIDGVEIVVSGTGRIAGRAVDAQTGRPIPEYAVLYEPERSGGGGVFRIVNRLAGQRLTGMGEKTEIRSDDGTFQLDDVPPGTWSVVVEAKGYQPARAGNVVVEEGGTVRDVEIKVSLGAALKGRVLDATTGQPVAGAMVMHGSAGAGAGAGPLAAIASTSPEDEVATDADGAFALEGLVPGKVSLTVKHPDYTDGHQTIDVKEGTGTAEIKLTPGSALGGLVVSDAQQPLPGADVVLQSAGDTGFGRGMLTSGSSTTSDASGRFRFDHLSAGRYSLVASLRSRSSATQTIVLQDGQSRDDAVLQIAAGATLQGVVSGIPDSSKNGMTVTVSGADSYAGSTRTGADGRFQFSGVPPGTATLRATAGSFTGSSRSVLKQVEMPDGQPVVETEIVFDPGYALSGRVTRGGQPLSGATVVANLIGGGGRQASSQTDDGGSYRMDGLAAGTYSVMAMANALGGSTRSQQVTLNGDQSVDIAFPSAKLGGTVVEAQGKTPLPDAVVMVTSTDPNAAPTGGRMARSATTDSNGAFQITDLDAASYTVNVQKTDYLFDKRDVTAAEQGTDALTFELNRGQGIGVIGRDGVYGVPLHGLMVRVLDSSRSPVYTGAITLDGSGSGEIPSLKPGAYTLTASASGYAVTTIPGVTVPSAPVTVSLTPGGSIEIHSGPKTLVSGTAQMQIVTAAGVPYPLNLFSATGTFAVSTPIRRIDNLAPGSYLLAVTGGSQQSFTVQEGSVTVVTLP